MRTGSPAQASLPLFAGAVGPPLFVLVFLVDGLVHPAYNAVTDFVSELSRGELGWLQILNFVVFGAAMIVFAAGIRWGTRRAAGSVAGPPLFALIGASLVAAGIFVTDAHTSTTATTAGTIHQLVSLVVFAGVIAACFVFARRFHGAMRVYSLLSGAAVLLLILATGIVGERVGATGVVQRVTIAVGWAWISILALALRGEPGPSPSASPSTQGRRGV